MAYLDTEDLDCIAFVDEKTNAVTVKFIGIPNKESADLFINYVMAVSYTHLTLPTKRIV